jgi:hypothetical protein
MILLKIPWTILINSVYLLAVANICLLLFDVSGDSSKFSMHRQTENSKLKNDDEYISQKNHSIGTATIPLMIPGRINMTGGCEGNKCFRPGIMNFAPFGKLNSL